MTLFEVVKKSNRVFRQPDQYFLLASLDEGTWFNAKADPDTAVEWREQYDEITPGYHMNKKLWNTVRIDGGLSEKQLCDMIDHSYDEVVKGLRKARYPRRPRHERSMYSS